MEAEWKGESLTPSGRGKGKETGIPAFLRDTRDSTRRNPPYKPPDCLFPSPETGRDCGALSLPNGQTAEEQSGSVPAA